MIVDNNIKQTLNDKRVYINKTFKSRSNGEFKILGIHSTTKDNIKRYLCEFEDGRLAVAEGGDIRKGYVRPTNNTREADTTEDFENNIIKLKRALQKARDELRIERKVTRESARDVNTIESLNRAILSVINDNPISVKTIEHNNLDGFENKGIVHWSDLHGNEQVNIIGNVYDWSVLSRRIRKHTLKNIKLFKALNVKDILISQTGDLLNSDRRLGEILTNSTNRAKAIFIIKDILISAILEYNKHFNVSIGFVVGNESRIDTDIYFEEQLASNNFDYMINRLIYEYLKNRDGISFVPYESAQEVVVEINGHNILLMHGHTIKSKKTISSIKAKYADNGIIIRFVIYGHIHETEIGTHSARSGSTVGNNAYSFYGLNLSGRASQNSYVVEKSGNIHSFAIDLQNCDDIEGYDVNILDDSYNSKSIKKYSKENNIKIYKV